jgi:hypothetical protein
VLHDVLARIDLYAACEGYAELLAALADEVGRRRGLETVADAEGD